MACRVCVLERRCKLLRQAVPRQPQKRPTLNSRGTAMSRFFIDRPIFAWVLGLVLMLGGGVEIFRLPVAQYPSIAAPQISITVTYPGASAQTVADTVVRPILQQMSGLDGLEYVA